MSSNTTSFVGAATMVRFLPFLRHSAGSSPQRGRSRSIPNDPVPARACTSGFWFFIPGSSDRFVPSNRRATIRTIGKLRERGKQVVLVESEVTKECYHLCCSRFLMLFFS